MLGCMNLTFWLLADLIECLANFGDWLLRLMKLPWSDRHWTLSLITKSTLVQVMAWCHQATSHYLSKCWPRSVSPYGVTRPQWVKVQISASVFIKRNCWIKKITKLSPEQNCLHFAVAIYKCIPLNDSFDHFEQATSHYLNNRCLFLQVI